MKAPIAAASRLSPMNRHSLPSTLIVTLIPVCAAMNIVVTLFVVAVAVFFGVIGSAVIGTARR